MAGVAFVPVVGSNLCAVLVFQGLLRRKGETFCLPFFGFPQCNTLIMIELLMLGFGLGSWAPVSGVL